MLERLARFLNRLLVNAIIDLEFVNLDTAPREGALIVAGNHLGVLDALIVYYVVDRRDYIVMLAEYHREHAFRRFLAKLVDAIFVDRYQADFTVLREVLKRLEAGGVLIISPEGTRSKTGGLLPGQPGTAYLAARSGVAVLPVSIVGSEDRLVMPNLKRLRRSPIRITFGEPITFEPVKRENCQEILQSYTDEIMCQIAALLPESYRGVYTNHPRLIEIINTPGYETPAS
jgi:1-acyl-sn-glycerol-3-phosphate acyltransferase